MEKRIVTEMNKAALHAAYAERLTRNKHYLPDDEYARALYELGEMALLRIDYAVLRAVLLRLDEVCLVNYKEEMLV